MKQDKRFGRSILKELKEGFSSYKVIEKGLTRLKD